MTASQLEKLRRKYALVQRHGQDPHPQSDEQRRYVRRRDTGDGMVKIEAVLHPEEAEMVWTMLNHAATQLLRGPSAAQVDDSAESPARASAHITAVTMSPTCSDVCEIGDSAQSLEMARAPVTASPTQSDPCGLDDSAESCETTQRRSAAVASLIRTLGLA